MAGGTNAHNQIVHNLSRVLGNQFAGRPCVVYTNDMKVKTSSPLKYSYPDVVAACGPLEFAGSESDSLLNPAVNIEVLSDSTEAYDRGLKFAHYRAIPSLGEYVLVSQYEPYVEQYQRQDDGTWRLAIIQGLGSVRRLAAVGCDVPLAEICDKVEFLPEGRRTLPLKPGEVSM